MDTSTIHDFSWAWANAPAPAGLPETRPEQVGAMGTCPLCAASASFPAGSGQGFNEQVSGAAGVASSASLPGLGQGDVITLRHRADAEAPYRTGRPASEQAPLLGVHAAYNAYARPVQGAEFEEQGHSGRFASPRDENSRHRNAGQTRAPQANMHQAGANRTDTRQGHPDQAGAFDQAGASGRAGESNQAHESEQTVHARQSRPAHDESELSIKERQALEQLRQRDAEVRAHEHAHIAAGGRHVSGAASYSYEQGPDGRQYAVGGEVSIDVSPVPGNPEQTEDKAQAVRRAALAPATPSAQDMKAALSASQMEAEARMEQLQDEQDEQTGRGQGADSGSPSVPAPSRPQTQPEPLSPSLSQTQPPSSDPSLLPFTFTPSTPVFTARPSTLIQAYTFQSAVDGTVSARA